MIKKKLRLTNAILVIILLLFSNCENDNKIYTLLNSDSNLKKLCNKISVSSENKILTIEISDTSSFYIKNFVELKFTYILYKIRDFSNQYDQIVMYNILTDKDIDIYTRSFSQNECIEIVNEIYMKNPFFIRFNEYMLANFNSDDIISFQVVIDDLNEMLQDFNFDQSIVELSYFYSLACIDSSYNSYYDRIKSLGVIYNYNNVSKELAYINFILKECERNKIMSNDSIPFQMKN